MDEKKYNPFNKYFWGALGTVAVLMGWFYFIPPVKASTLDEAAQSTYILYDNDDGFCSGTVVDKDKILTAYHCTDNGPINIKKITYDEKPKDGKFPMLREEVIYMKVLRGFKATDSALLGTIDGKPLGDNFGKPIDVASVEEVNKELKLGTPLWVLGYPRIGDLTLTDGMFTAKSVVRIPEIDDEIFYKTTVHVDGGSSGGGLYMKFGDEYKLIGTTTAMAPSEVPMTFFATIENVHKTLQNMIDEPISADDPSRDDKTDKPTFKIDDR